MTLTNTWPRANSTLEISVQAGDGRRYNGHPTSEEAQGCYNYSKYCGEWERYHEAKQEGDNICFL